MHLVIHPLLQVCLVSLALNIMVPLFLSRYTESTAEFAVYFQTPSLCFVVKIEDLFSSPPLLFVVTAELMDLFSIIWQYICLWSGIYIVVYFIKFYSRKSVSEHNALFVERTLILTF